MIHYFDTSALVKVYIEEDYSIEVRKLYAETDRIAINKIGYVDFFSALNRLLRENMINTNQYHTIMAHFKSQWHYLMVIELDNELIGNASNILINSDLRAFDSIHLASAEYLRQNFSEEIIFVCFDKRLVNCSKNLNFPTL